jgi:hypothetical protein
MINEVYKLLRDNGFDFVEERKYDYVRHSIRFKTYQEAAEATHLVRDIYHDTIGAYYDDDAFIHFGRVSNKTSEKAMPGDISYLYDFDTGKVKQGMIHGEPMKYYAKDLRKIYLRMWTRHHGAKKVWFKDILVFKDNDKLQKFYEEFSYRSYHVKLEILDERRIHFYWDREFYISDS